MDIKSTITTYEKDGEFYIMRVYEEYRTPIKRKDGMCIGRGWEHRITKEQYKNKKLEENMHTKMNFIVKNPNMTTEELNEFLECEGFIYFEGNKRAGRTYPEQIDMTKYDNLGELLGGLSMWWNPIPSGVFDSSSAQQFADEIENRYNSIPHAVGVLIKALKEDPSYFYSWQANIAMQFKDLVEYKSLHGFGSMDNRKSEKVAVLNEEQIHELANQAAINFLNLLINDSKGMVK